MCCLTRSCMDPDLAWLVLASDADGSYASRLHGSWTTLSHFRPPPCCLSALFARGCLKKNQTWMLTQYSCLTYRCQNCGDFPNWSGRSRCRRCASRVYCSPHACTGSTESTCCSPIEQITWGWNPVVESAVTSAMQAGNCTLDCALLRIPNRLALAVDLGSSKTSTLNVAVEAHCKTLSMEHAEHAGINGITNSFTG